MPPHIAFVVDIYPERYEAFQYSTYFIFFGLRFVVFTAVPSFVIHAMVSLAPLISRMSLMAVEVGRPRYGEITEFFFALILISTQLKISTLVIEQLQVRVGRSHSTRRITA
jgi:hypothetical protein